MFDKEEGNWHVHLNGARKMINILRSARTRSLPSDFLAAWFLYYEVLADFTRPIQRSDDEDECYFIVQSFKPDISVVSHHPGISLFPLTEA